MGSDIIEGRADGSRRPPRPWAIVAVATGLLCAWAVTALACSSTGTTTTQTPSSTPSTSTAELSGSAVFTTRSPLPDGATLSVALVEQSTPGAPVFAETSAAVGGMNAPLDFTLPYDLSAVDPNGLYSVVATVSAGGTDLFVSKGQVLVITQGRPSTGVQIPMKEP